MDGRECIYCGRAFGKNHKVVDTCHKCKHLMSRGRKITRSPDFRYNAGVHKIAQSTVPKNPLLDWIDKK